MIIEVFSGKYKEFVEENSFPKTKDQEVEIRYIAEIKKIKQVSPQHASRLKNYYIWTKNHVKSYLSNRTGYIWVLRIYKLDKPKMASAKRAALTFANLNKNISLENMVPVIDDKNFEKIIRTL